jgi:hypothetical protein
MQQILKMPVAMLRIGLAEDEERTAAADISARPANHSLCYACFNSKGCK